MLETITGVGRERTSLSKLKNFLLSVPPYAEQEGIVGKIETLFAIMEKCE